MSATCECYGGYIASRDVAHGMQYGTADPITNAFIPSRDSAPTIICQSCGSMLLNLIYQKLNPSKAHQTSLF